MNKCTRGCRELCIDASISKERTHKNKYIESTLVRMWGRGEGYVVVCAKEFI